MSPEEFNIWFPALVGGLLIGLLGAAIWDFLRRKTWCFASRFWPGILTEVGLDNSSLSRAEVEEKQREVTDMLSALSTQITRALVPVKSSMAEAAGSTAAEYSNSSVSSNCGVTYDFDLEAQTGGNPTYTPVTFTVTAYFPDDTPIVVIRPTKKLFKRYAKGTVKRWRSSIILQESLPIEPCVLAEIGELAKKCMHEENRCIFQLGNWAILYYNAGKVHLHILKEGNVPVNVEARWQTERSGITMRGLYLNGAQVKVATKRTSTILRTAGPATQGARDLDKLHLPTEELDVPGEDSLIYASKLVEADGISLIVRSEAIFILPPREKFALIVALWGQLQRISIFAKKMINFFLKAEDRLPETSANRPEVRFDDEHLELIAEHWKGVSEIELLENRKEVLHYVQELRTSRIVERAGPQPPQPHLNFTRDEHYLEYWQKGLQDLNEVIHRNINDPQSDTHISIRGGIKFLLGDFEDALQDFDLAYLKMGGHQSTVLLERALVKCMLARYSEAMQDVVAVISINPNLNGIQELQTCIQQILDQQAPIRRVQPDLLTGGVYQVCQRLDKHCEERSRIGSTDCIDNRGPLSEDTSVLGKCRGADAFEDSLQEIRRDDYKVAGPVKPLTKSLTSVPLPCASAPNTEAATLPRDPSTPSDLCRDEQGSAEKLDQDDNTGCKEGGVRFRENLGKYVVEFRPQGFNWKLWMGTYATGEEAMRACDCARFYTSQVKGGFYFKDSPAVFGELGPLNRPFNLVSKDVKDKTFVVELMKRAKQVIRKDLAARKAKQPVDPHHEESKLAHSAQQDVAASAAVECSFRRLRLPNFLGSQKG